MSELVVNRLSFIFSRSKESGTREKQCLNPLKVFCRWCHH